MNENLSTQGTNQETQDASWLEAIPEEYRGDPNVTKYQSLEELVKGHVNLAKMRQQQTDGLVKVPGEDASEEEIAAFRAAIGVPESAEGYELPEIPEGAEVDGNLVDAFRSTAQEMGLNPKQFQKAVEWYNQYGVKVAEENAARLNDHYKGEAGVKKAVANASNALSQIQDQELRETLGRFVGRDELVTRLLDELGQKFREEPAPRGSEIVQTTDVSKLKQRDKELTEKLNSDRYQADPERKAWYTERAEIRFALKQQEAGKK